MSNKAFEIIIKDTINNGKTDKNKETIYNSSNQLSAYNILNSYDQDTLNRMSSNVINSSDDVKQLPSYTNFVQNREPSLTVGLHPIPVSNMTTLSNQLYRSLDLLAKTDQLAISNIHKQSNILETSNIISSNDILDQINNIQGIAAPHIPYNEYEKPTAYFDNYVGNGRSDIIKEYICHINSIDRDIKYYQNPFNFLVKFAPLSGDNNASISRTFQNIRYVKIETAVLPRHYFITKTELNTINLSNQLINNLFQSFDLVNHKTQLDNKIIDEFIIIYSYVDTINNKLYINYTNYEPDISITIKKSYEVIKDLTTETIITYQYQISCISIENDKYTILYLNDINDVSQFSTDLALSKAFNVLYPEIISGNSIYVNCRYADKIYKYSDLGNMTKMELILTNSLGKPLSINIKALDFNVSTLNSTICTCTNDNITGNIIRDYKCICNYIRHPRFMKIQIDLMFKFGIVETEFNKRAFN